MYWREYAEPERKEVLASIQRELETYDTPAGLAARFPSQDFSWYLAIAQEHLQTTFDVPSSFSERARQGLLGAATLSALDDDLFESEQEYKDPQLGTYVGILMGHFAPIVDALMIDDQFGKTEIPGA